MTVSKPGMWRKIAGFLVTVLVAAGIVTVITNSLRVLAVFMVVLVLLWAGSTVRHLFAPRPGAVSRSGVLHA